MQDATSREEGGWGILRRKTKGRKIGKKIQGFIGNYQLVDTLTSITDVSWLTDSTDFNFITTVLVKLLA